jgi:hypothetical protein
MEKTMWPFKSNDVRKEAEAIVKKVLDEALLHNELKTSADLSGGIKDEFVKMNTQLLEVFDKTNKTAESNSRSIIALSEAIKYTVQSLSALDIRLKALESKLSVTDIKFSNKVS